LGLLNRQFETAAKKNPNEIAIIFGDFQIDYRKLNNAIQRFASGLARLGIKQGDRVALLLPNVPHYIICYYGILHLGATVVPLSVTISKEELDYYLTDCGATALVGWTGLKSTILNAVQKSNNCKDVIFLGQSIPSNTHSLTSLIASAEPLKYGIETPGDTFSIINYTSGVADVALGAEMTQGAISSSAMTCQEEFFMSSDDSVMAVLPLSHPLGQTLMMHATFTAGATCVLLPKYSINAVAESIDKNGVTNLPGVPGIFKSLLEYKNENGSFETLKYCISYGGRLEEDSIKEFEDRFHCILFKAYGLTETAAIISANRIHKERKHNAVGLPILGTEIEIRTNQVFLASSNKIGEIWVNGPTVMIGYHNKPEETANKLIDGWLFTGDVGYLDDDFILFVIERKEDIIEKDGFEIFPREIEEVIKRNDAISEIAIVGVPDYAHGTEVKAFVVLKKDQNMTREDLFQFCKGSLPLYKCPQHIEFCKEIPKSATGRVLKKVLRKSVNKSQNRLNNRVLA
jgi:long-chain acyl-CoA synthetase